MTGTLHLWRLSNSRYRKWCSSNPLINISGIIMSVLPNIIKWASQTQIYNSQVCHTCQHVTVCMNCDNACQVCNRCSCTVGKVISVHGCWLTAYRQASYWNFQCSPLGKLRDLWSLISRFFSSRSYLTEGYNIFSHYLLLVTIFRNNLLCNKLFVSFSLT